MLIVDKKDALDIVSGTLPVVRGGTGVATSTGTGNVVLNASPTLVTPNIGVATGTSFNSITGLASSTPIAGAAAYVGTSTLASRQDHVHPAVTGTIFNMTWPLVANTSAGLQSHTNITYTGSTNTLTAPNINATTFTGALVGNASTATTLQTARTIAITGDLTYTSGSFNGSADVTGVGTLANTGVTAGTYRSVTTDSKGRITAGTNPTTVSDYGLTDVYTKTEVNNSLALKVDKISGKGLSTEDYSTADKSKLDGIAASANNYSLPVASASVLGGVKAGTNVSIDANGVISANDSSVAWSEVTSKPTFATVATSGSYVDLSNKPTIPTTLPASDVYAWAKASAKPSYAYSEITGTPTIPTVPTKVSSFTNDSGYQTSAQVNTAIQAVVGAAPDALNTLAEIATQLANDESAVSALTTTVSNKVDKVVGKQLSTEDYTTVEKSKLAGIADNANNYTLPVATSTAIGGVELYSDTVQTVASNAVSRTAGRTYGVQLNSEGQAVVNVPWSDTSTAYTHPNSGVTAGTYSKVTVNTQGHITDGASLSASDIPNLDASKITTGTIDSARLPSFVDDVLEFANLAGFPTTGEAGKIYIALDTNKSYRWSGSTYVYITSGAVDSVAGKTGVVTLVKADVGLGNVDNTSDANKPVSTATQTALDLKANRASPALTGAPTAPTAVVGTSNTVLATTAFVNAEIANDTYSKTQLDAGQLDNRYYTEAEVDSKLAANEITVTDNAIARYNGTTGKLQNSSVVIDDNGNVGIGTTAPARKLEVQSYGVGAAGILRISGLAGSGSITNASLLELSITGAGGGTVTQNLTARYNNGYEIATYFEDRVSWRDNATNTQLFAIDSSGNALVTNSTGGLGYGTGAGGTVTQLTSKSTAVTLNKPTGQIITSNSSLAAGATNGFTLNNSLLTGNDTVKVIVGGTGAAGAYQADCRYCINRTAHITVKNIDTVSRTEVVAINFTVIKGANS